jgi:hypothetical protein
MRGNILPVPFSDTSPSAQAVQFKIQQAMGGEQRLLFSVRNEPVRPRSRKSPDPAGAPGLARHTGQARTYKAGVSPCGHASSVAMSAAKVLD